MTIETKVNRKKKVDSKVKRKNKNFDTKYETDEVARDLGNRKKFHAHDLVSLELKNERQVEFFEAYYDETPIIMLDGYPGVGKSFLAMYAALNDVFSSEFPQERVVIVRSAVESGTSIGFLPGPQPLSSKVLTPNGWVKMGDLENDDYVVSSEGKPTKVLDVYDFEEQDVYEITTTTGKKTYSTLSHLWETQDYNEFKHNKKGSVKTLEEIKNTLHYKNGKINHYLPRLNPVQFQNEEKLLHPYVLGCLLGDGSIGSSICISSIDEELVNRIDCLLKPINAGITGVNNIQYRIGAIDRRPNKPEGKNEKGRYTNPVKQELDNLGLMNKKFHDKFIPESYIYNASVEDRMELLRGLLDTDGTVHRGQAEFFTSNLNLVEDMKELVRSLGGSCHVSDRFRVNESEINDRQIKSTCKSYACTIKLPENVGNPFYLQRKAEKYSTEGIDGRKLNVTPDRIESVEYFSTEPVRCIKVEDNRHLYVTDEFILTHNTEDEKMEPFEAPYKQITSEIMKFKNPYDHLKSLGYLDFILTTHCRGITLKNSIILIEEAQCMDYDELKTVITRMGENSRIIITGDEKQDDLKRKRRQSGMQQLKKVFENMDEVDTSVISFEKEDVVRNGVVKNFLIADFETGEG